MKKWENVRTFLSGMLAAALIMGCGTAALAAGSGKMSAGSMGVLINRVNVIRAGDKATNANGKKIPATIVYTDEAGGDNTYLPIRTISELLDIPVTWKDNNIYLGLAPAGPGKTTITSENSIPTALRHIGAKAGPYTEMSPRWSEDYTNAAGCLLGGIRMRQTTAVSGSIDTLMDKGGYYSISVTNNTKHPMIFTLSSVSTITQDPFPATVIPAGETVVRTFQVEACKNAVGLPPLEYHIGFDTSTVSPRTEADITLSARGFSKL